MDNAGNADLKRLVEDPEDAPLVESGDDEFARATTRRRRLRTRRKPQARAGRRRSRRLATDWP
jgi:hypothetical protein